MAPLNLTPPAIVRELHADERGLASPSGSAFAKFALDRQGLVRLLGRDATTARAAERLRPAERDDVEARLDLQKLSDQTPPLRTKIRLGPSPPADSLQGWYREAQRRFDVGWQYLAAINFVESGFDKLRNSSVDGAQGPMQFIPATWAAYGLGGNVHDPHDAILGAANYLAANHGRTDIRTALWHYNPSHLYVDAIMHLAHRMATVRYAFREYWTWRAYVRSSADPRA